MSDSVERAGWSAPVVAAVAVRPGEVGEGWLKQFITFAKGVAQKAGVVKPLEMASFVSASAVRLTVSFDAELTQADREFLAAHFTGTPPSGYEAAQRMVDDLNRHSPSCATTTCSTSIAACATSPARAWDTRAPPTHPDLAGDTQGGPRPVAAPATEKAAAAFDKPATAHPVNETAKLRGLLLRFIDQSRLQKGEQDGSPSASPPPRPTRALPAPRKPL